MESLRRLQALALRSPCVALEARHGLLGDGRIRLDGKRSRVRQDTGGWFVVEDVPPWESARVLYREVQDLAIIQWPGAILRVVFHAGEGEFVWEERRYHIGSMIEGEIRIQQEARTVAEGHGTVAGLHLESVATELLPIIRPLAWALVLRGESIARQNRVPAAAG